MGLALLQPPPGSVLPARLRGGVSPGPRPGRPTPVELRATGKGTGRGHGVVGGRGVASGSGGRKEGASQSCDLGGGLLIIRNQRGRQTKEQSALLPALF